MSSQPRGKVLIIDNEDFENDDVLPKRHGSKNDSEKLEILFKNHLGFEVDRKQNKLV